MADAREMIQSMEAWARRSPDWSVTLAAVAGGATVVAIPFLLFVIGADVLLEAIDGPASGPYLLVGAAIAVAFAWRRPDSLALRPFLLGYAGVALTLAAVFSGEMFGGIAAWLFLPFVFALPILPVPAQLRAMGTIPVLLIMALGVDSGINDQVSGIALALLGFAYFALWAVREHIAWARHMAWAGAALWSGLAFLISVSDLLLYIDPVAIVGSVTAAVLLAVSASSWLVSQRRVGRASPS